MDRSDFSIMPDFSIMSNVLIMSDFQNAQFSHNALFSHNELFELNHQGVIIKLDHSLGGNSSKRVVFLYIFF